MPRPYSTTKLLDNLKFSCNSTDLKGVKECHEGVLGDNPPLSSNKVVLVVSRISLNSNIASLKAQRRLTRSTNSLNESFTRLSSGLRINKASDDASGLAISSSLNTDKRVFNQGIRNLNDGVSLLRIADSALGELSNITVRLMELSEQSANGTLSHLQRKALDKEAQALSEEFLRISKTTEFNGLRFFEGGTGEISLQVGYGENGGISDGLGGAIGDGTFAAGTSFSVDGQVYNTDAGDFNGDGIVDLVSAQLDTDSISVLLGVGDGTFSSSVSYSAGNGTVDVRTGDFNGDGVLDIATSERLDTAVSVFIGVGDGTFQARTSYSTSGQGFGLELGDFNGDGKQDIVDIDLNTDSVSVLLGVGDGTFHPATSFSVGNGPRHASVSDFNGDGIDDIVTSNYIDDTVHVLLGNGDGSFAASTSYSVSNSFGIATEDFNGDNIVDIATSNLGDGTISIMLGVGDGTFGASTSFAADTTPSIVKTGDFNGDGLVDLAVSGNTSQSFSILLGAGDGSFDAPISYTGSVNRRALTAADVDGDGVEDIITSDLSSATVTVFSGNTEEGVAPLLPFSLETMAGARQALPVFERKLNQLASQRAQIGAFESRLSTALATTRIAVENFAAASSRITDVDVAQESAELVRQQILQQAGSAVLGQANQLPQLALQLLQG